MPDIDDLAGNLKKRMGAENDVRAKFEKMTLEELIELDPTTLSPEDTQVLLDVYDQHPEYRKLLEATKVVDPSKQEDDPSKADPPTERKKEEPVSDPVNPAGKPKKNIPELSEEAKARLERVRSRKPGKPVERKPVSTTAADTGAGAGAGAGAVAAGAGDIEVSLEGLSNQRLFTAVPGSYSGEIVTLEKLRDLGLPEKVSPAVAKVIRVLVERANKATATNQFVVDQYNSAGKQLAEYKKKASVADFRAAVEEAGWEWSEEMDMVLDQWLALTKGNKITAVEGVKQLAEKFKKIFDTPLGKGRRKKKNEDPKGEEDGEGDGEGAGDDDDGEGEGDGEGAGAAPAGAGSGHRIPGTRNTKNRSTPGSAPKGNLDAATDSLRQKLSN